HTIISRVIGDQSAELSDRRIHLQQVPPRRTAPATAVGAQDLERRHRGWAAVATPGSVDDYLDALSQWQVADIGRREGIQQPGHSVVRDGHQPTPTGARGV